MFENYSTIDFTDGGSQNASPLIQENSSAHAFYLAYHSI